VVRNHHERFDGTGYPRGLQGEQIPLFARIFMVADAFDAIVSKRVYKDAISPEWALEEIRRSAGTHFDPTVVRAFERVYPSIVASVATAAAPSPSLSRA
jgi:HD-GYP domain-containing protein (c-di-GMP phosphodiesterase class II)